MVNDTVGNAGSPPAKRHRVALACGADEWLRIGLLFCIVILAAAPGWRGSFVWDDLNVVQGSEFQALPPISFAREVMTRDFGLEVDEQAMNYYRPVVLISLKLNRAFADPEFHSPAPYRAVNALIHFLNAALLYGCLRLVIPPDKNNRFKSVGAISAALIFACAGWNAEIVSFISARCESLGLFFALLGGFVWLWRSARQRFPIISAGFVLLCFVASLMSKETTIPVIAALPMLTLIFVTGERRRRFIEMACVAWGALLIYGVVRTAAGVSFPSGFFLQALTTDWSREARALYHYLIHLAWPAGVLAREPIGLSRVTYPQGVLVAAGLMGLLWTAALLVAVRVRPRLVGFSLICGAMLFLPALLLHGKDGTYAICERFLYMSAAGLAVCGGVFVERLMSRRSVRGRAYIVAGFSLFLALHIGLQVSKNVVWSEEVRFWRYQNSVVSSPAASPLLYGMALKRAGRLEEAELQLTHVAKHVAHPYLRGKAAKALQELGSGDLDSIESQR